ncbi:MAG TPA: 4Fe-4S binding protein [Gemmataceae bacterium]|nr:4Fe-4S binding protein [Gemmataceae bacterium]
MSDPKCVVCEPCYDCKYAECATVCPVDCFYQDETMLYIHQDDCVACYDCIDKCPVQAIYKETDLKPEWAGYKELNAERARALAEAGIGNLTQDDAKAQKPLEGPNCKKRV